MLEVGHASWVRGVLGSRLEGAVSPLLPRSRQEPPAASAPGTRTRLPPRARAIWDRSKQNACSSAASFTPLGAGGGGRGAWSRALCAWGWAARLQGTQKSRGLPWTAPSSPSSAASPQVVKPRRGRGTCPKSQGFLEQLGGVPRQRGGLRVSEEELGLCQHLPSGLSFQDACPLVRGPDLPTLGLQQLLLGSWPLPR